MGIVIERGRLGFNIVELQLKAQDTSQGDNVYMLTAELPAESRVKDGAYRTESDPSREGVLFNRCALCVYRESICEPRVVVQKPSLALLNGDTTAFPRGCPIITSGQPEGATLWRGKQT